MKIDSTNSINTHISKNKKNNIDKNYVINNENKIIPDFNKDINKDKDSSDINSKSRNNKPNLPYQSSDELIKLALKKNEKTKQKKPIISN